MLNLIKRFLQYNTSSLPTNSDYKKRGNEELSLGNLDAAAECYKQAIHANPNQPENYVNLGFVLSEQQKYEEAIDNLNHALVIDSNNVDAIYLLGIIAKNKHQSTDAIKYFIKVIEIQPSFHHAYQFLFSLLSEIKDDDLIEKLLCSDIIHNINSADFFYWLGEYYTKKYKFTEALESYNKAIRLKADFADAYFNCGNILRTLKQSERAIESYNHAITIRPEFADAYVGRGLALQAINQLEAAVESHDQAIAIKPDFAEAHVSRGISLELLKQLEAAVISYEKAFTIKPDFENLLGTLLYLKMKLCDWTNIKEKMVDLSERINRGEKASLCFPMLSLSTSPAIQRKTTELFLHDRRYENHSLGTIPKNTDQTKIRIGYFSGDFHLHPVLVLMMGIYELHDRSRFELIAFSFGPDSNDEIRQKAQQMFDRFIDIRNQPDKAVALLVRELKIDIAVDLGGYTTRSCFDIFSYRAAPIQVNYLGYPGTMGADYYDYIIADETIIPPTSQCYYVEKIVYLPSYQPNDSTRVISEKKFTRKELGLPDEGFVFCCLNNNYKITPDTFDGWMRILKTVESSVLLLCADTKTAGENLKKEAEIRGVNPDRLVFVNRMNDAGEYLARYRAADLFLDTFPYNAQATASDVLWAGLPLLTLTGETFTSRVAASLLKAVGLTELITDTQENYEALAIKLATHPTKLNMIKEKLFVNRLSAPLFNTKLYTQRLENAYTQMVERYQADLTPDHIYVE